MLLLLFSSNLRPLASGPAGSALEVVLASGVQALAGSSSCSSGLGEGEEGGKAGEKSGAETRTLCSPTGCVQ